MDDKNTPHHNSEIDLFIIVAKLINFILKRKTIVLICMISGIFLGQYYVSKNETNYRPYYKKDFVIRTPLTSEQTFLEILNIINLKIQSQDTSGLTIPMNLIQETKSIKHVSSYTELHGALNLKLSIEVYDKEKTDRIINAILLSIASNKYVKERFETMQKLINNVNTQLEETEKLLNATEQSNDNNTAILKYIQRMDKFNSIELYELKHNLQKELSMAESPVEVVIGDAPVVYVNNKTKLILSYLAFTLLGLLTGIILSAIPEIFAKIKQQL